ncbi:MAG: glycosyltransferase family 1 protein [Pseudomonadota bacterium]
MKIVIVTDAWKPQINGVVRTLSMAAETLVVEGHDVLVINPQGRRSFPCPSYPEIRLAFFQGRSIAAAIDEFAADCIHIATEGPLGMAARRYCRHRNLAFTTSYHTQFPEYVRARFPIPTRWTYAILRRFHGSGSRTMVATPTMQQQLIKRGFTNIVTWTRGVDTQTFKPDAPYPYELPRPVWVYTGRVAVEKNIEAFLRLELPGSKVVIGDGPDREKLEAQYASAEFFGYRFGDELASLVAGADAFVFPSVTDTFGLVMLEAMACGVPVAAYPVVGPIDVVTPGVTGVLNDDLATACQAALELDRAACRRFAEGHSWRHSIGQFFSNLVYCVNGQTVTAKPQLATVA